MPASEHVAVPQDHMAQFVRDMVRKVLFCRLPSPATSKVGYRPYHSGTTMALQFPRLCQSGPMPLDIVFTSATVSYAGRVAIHLLSLTLSERRIGVVGLNGSGKTTMARLINGLVKPSTGTVTVDGFDTIEDEKAVRGKIGFIFQNPQHQMILPILAEDIAFGLKNRGLEQVEIAARTAAILDRLGISHLARRRVHELSGGEAQLGAIASVLVTGPDLLILDEPTNQLDLKNRALIARTIAALPEQVLVVTHDLSLVHDFDRVLVFHEGRLAADALPAEAIHAYREVAAC